MALYAFFNSVCLDFAFALNEGMLQGLVLLCSDHCSDKMCKERGKAGEVLS